MALNVKWNKRAENSLSKILIYLQDEFGDSTTRKFAQHLFKTVDLIAEFPEIGKSVEKHKQIRGLVLIKQVSLFYHFDEKQVVVLNLFDNRRKPKKK